MVAASKHIAANMLAAVHPVCWRHEAASPGAGLTAWHTEPLALQCALGETALQTGLFQAQPCSSCVVVARCCAADPAALRIIQDNPEQAAAALTAAGTNQAAAETLGAAVTQVATTNVQAAATATVVAATADTGAFANVLASAQASAEASGNTAALASATTQAFVQASEGAQTTAVTSAWAEVRTACNIPFGLMHRRFWSTRPLHLVTCCCSGQLECC
jgi:hypothetical protein